MSDCADLLNAPAISYELSHESQFDHTQWSGTRWLRQRFGLWSARHSMLRRRFVRVIACGSHSEQLLASGSDDETGRIWRLPHNASAAPWHQQCIAVLRGHHSNVFSVKFLPGSGDQWLVTGGNDGSCRLYDVDTQTQLSFMAHHSRKVAVRHNCTARFYCLARFFAALLWTPTQF